MSRVGVMQLFSILPLAAMLLAGCESPHERLTALERGKKEFHSGHWHEAIQACSEAIQAHPGDWEPFVYRGRAYMALEDANRAIADYSRAIELSPKTPEAYYNRAIAYRELAKRSGAAADRTRFEERASQDQLAGDKLDPAYQNKVDQLRRMQVLEDQRMTAEATRARKEREDARREAEQSALVKGDDRRAKGGEPRRRRGDSVAEAHDEHASGGTQNRDDRTNRSSRDARGSASGESQTRYYRDQFGLPVELGDDQGPAGDTRTDSTRPNQPREFESGSDLRPRRPSPSGAFSSERRAAARERRTGRQDETSLEDQLVPSANLNRTVPLTRRAPAAPPRRSTARRATPGDPFSAQARDPFAAPRQPVGPASPFGGRAATPFSAGERTELSGADPSQFGPSDSAASGTRAPATPFSGQATTPFSNPASTPYSAPASNPFAPSPTNSPARTPFQ